MKRTIFLLSALVLLMADLNGQNPEASTCEPELSTVLEMIFEHPKVKRHYGQFLTGDTLLLNSELVPECGQPVNIDMGAYRILIRGINDIFFYSLDYESTSNRIVSFHTNWVYTRLEVLMNSQRKTLYISAVVSHKQKEKDGVKSEYEINELITSLGRVK